MRFDPRLLVTSCAISLAASLAIALAAAPCDAAPVAIDKTLGPAPAAKEDRFRAAREAIARQDFARADALFKEAIAKDGPSPDATGSVSTANSGESLCSRVGSFARASIFSSITTCR